MSKDVFVFAQLHQTKFRMGFSREQCFWTNYVAVRMFMIVATVYSSCDAVEQ